VVKITPLIPDVLVNSPELLDSLLAPIAGFLSVTDCSLYPAKLRLRGMVIAGIVDRCPVTEHSKACNADINAGQVSGCRSGAGKGRMTLKPTYHLPHDFLRVTVLICPAIGRCSFTLSSPTPMM
jgi:hypothetical protein